MLISVVVPMKDEEGSLPLLENELSALAGSLAGRGDRLEVILVDDGSTDGTAAVAEPICARHEDWQLVQHSKNRGFGAGLRTGVAAASGDVLVSYDADCAYPAADVLTLLAALDAGADVASATPFADGGAADAGALRLLVSRTCSTLYRLVLRGRARGIRTFTCAFRAYRADRLRRTGWRADGFLAAAEIVSRLLLDGARVVEVPSTLRPRVAGVSKMRVVRVAWAHLGLLARLAVTPAGSGSATAPARGVG